MEKLTLSNIEHAFYKSGEASGSAAALEKTATDLKVIIGHYQSNGQTIELVSHLLQNLSAIVVAAEGDAAKRRQEFTTFINQALQLRKVAMPLYTKVRRAIKAFMAELEG